MFLYLCIIIIRCCSCELTFPSNSVLINHVKLTHYNSNNFHCTDSSCQTFSLLDSFIWHRRNKHEYKLETSSEPVHPDILSLEKNKVINIFDNSCNSSDSKSKLICNEDLLWDYEANKTTGALLVFKHEFTRYL